MNPETTPAPGDIKKVDIERVGEKLIGNKELSPDPVSQVRALLQEADITPFDVRLGSDRTQTVEIVLNGKYRDNVLMDTGKNIQTRLHEQGIKTSLMFFALSGHRVFIPGSPS